MHIADLRQFQSEQQAQQRLLSTIDHVVLYQWNRAKGTEKPIFHYAILADGTIEYLHDIEKILQNASAIDIALVGDLQSDVPPRAQLQATADLLSYLLISRSTTPNLHHTSQVHAFFELSKDANHRDKWKQWHTWRDYVLGKKVFAQPDFFAEYIGQKLILRQNGDITYKVTFKNSGDQSWFNYGEYPVKLNVSWEGHTSSAKLYKKYGVSEGSSIFRHESWVDEYCPCLMYEREVKPGEVASFFIVLAGNRAKPGTYIEDFGLARGPKWIDNLVNGNPVGKAHCWFEIEVV
jgi:hypothetical protein